MEQASGYSLLHGECVAIGMVLEVRIAEHLGVAECGTAAQIEDLLRRASLPVALPASMDAETILAASRHDKKSRGGAVEYALPTRIGAMIEAGSAWAIPVDDAVVREVLS